MPKYLIKSFLCMLLIILCFSGCSKDENGARDAVAKFYESIFIVVPTDCIDYKGWSDELESYKFEVKYNPVEYHKDEQPDAEFSGKSIEEVIFVADLGEHYKIMDEQGNMKTYIPKTFNTGDGSEIRQGTVLCLDEN